MEQFNRNADLNPRPQTDVNVNREDIYFCDVLFVCFLNQILYVVLDKALELLRFSGFDLIQVDVVLL